MFRRLVSFALLVSALVLGFASTAGAIPSCEGPVSQKVLYSGLGVLESLAPGGGGKLFVSGTEGDAATDAKLLRFDRPGKAPKAIASAGPGPGGLAWNGRRLIWGNGNTVPGGSTGDQDPQARLLSVHPKTGSYFTWARGLGMANGLTRTRNGVFFASNDFGEMLDRISPRRVTDHGWADVKGGNGMVVGRNGRFLFVNQTFENPGSIARVDITDPSRVKTWFSAAGLDTPLPAFDGLARDDQNNLYAAAWALGEVWKITPDRRACALASGIPQVSNLSFGGGKKRGFDRGSLYAVNFLGDLVRIRGARRAAVPSD